MRQRRDHDVAVLALPAGAGADRTVAGLIHRTNFALRSDDLGLGGIVRALDVLEQVLEAGIRFIEQMHAGGGHLAHIVRRDVGGHADGNAGSTVEQHVRQARRHGARLLQRAVKVGRPLHRALLQLGQQDLREAREPRLGVAHGGERLGIVGRAPVALAVNQRIAVAERLGHEHHGLVTGGVAVRMEFAEHVAHGARRFLVLAGGAEPEFRHRVNDAPLHRLETVADVRQRAIEDDVHGVVQVRLLGERGERQALDRDHARARDGLRLAAFRRGFFARAVSLAGGFLCHLCAFKCFGGLRTARAALTRPT